MTKELTLSNMKTFLLILALVVIGIIAWWALPDTNTNNDISSEDINTTENRKTYTSAEYGLSFSYPGDWPDELHSRDTITYIDSISQQELTHPLIELSVWQYDETVTEYQTWVSEHSASEDEQTSVRADIKGYYGIQQWVWHQRNPRDSSSWSYYIFFPHRVIEVRAWTDIDDPALQQFDEVQEEVQRIFDSLALEV
ncbi:MAG: hypothetical protein Q8P56_00395 [Candidatus Uhrbacteria bacterium]|nr:hypothetical protein [Candidatus Uhrbacteria bacterium]